jgi:hypothetical protein
VVEVLLASTPSPLQRLGPQILAAVEVDLLARLILEQVAPVLSSSPRPSLLLQLQVHQQ